MNFLLKRLILILVWLLPASMAAETDTFLKLDTRGHTSKIQAIAVDNSGNIISAGDDKTIRVWDSSGNEIRKILGQIGSGSEGKIYTIALSPDNRYLAVGGYFNSGHNERVRIYDYRSGKLLHVLKSHANVVLNVAFSPDGRYLVSGSHDKTVKVWDTATWKLYHTITTHTATVTGVGAFKRANDDYIASVSYDNTVSLYNLTQKRVFKRQDLGFRLKYLDISTHHIAVCGLDEHEVVIFDRELNPVKTIENSAITSGLKFSADGSQLLVGRGSTPNHVNLYTVPGFRLKTTFEQHTNFARAVGFIDGGTAVSGGGSSNEIYVWDTADARVKTRIAGAGRSVWSVGIDGTKIAWGNRWTKNNGMSRLQKAIDLDTFEISHAPQGFRRIATTNGALSLARRKGGEFGYDNAILDIKQNGTTVTSVTRKPSDGYRHRCYGWYKDLIISGGSGGFITVYNTEGKKVATLLGHTGDVWSIAVDGDRLVSGSYDQTIRVWNLAGIDHTGLNQTLTPILNLFVSEDEEYVVWSKSGYFTSSVGGDRYVGYHINQGPDKEARYVGSDKYFDTLYRPDIIANILKTGSEKKAIAYASRTKKVKQVDVAAALPPVVSLLSPGTLSTQKETVTITYEIDSNDPVTGTVITRNGTKLDTRALKPKKQGKGEILTVDLDNGLNIIAIKARNKHAFSDEVLVRVTRQSGIKTADIFKPTLYVLSIGVSEYENPRYNLGVAHEDAKAIAAMMQAQKGKVYKDVVVKTFINKHATSDDILDGLDWIDKEVTSKDVAVIFIAGHGVNDDKGDYYFLSHDANLERLRRTAVPWYEVQRTIDNLPSKTILLADTCHSGNIAGTRRDITSAIKSIINSGAGSVIMTATTGNGYSYEQSDWGHGAFTKSLLEGLQSFKADFDRDGVVTIKEIDLYVTNRVKKLTGGKQKPTTIIPQSVPDFAIGVK